MLVLAAENTHSRTYPALPESVPDARAFAARAAVRAGARSDVIDSLRLAVSEATTNVVLHAYDGTPGELQVTVAVADQELWVLVADDGRGHQSVPDSPGLGWGLALIANACQDFLITERSGGGTELRMGFPLPAAERVAATARTGRFSSILGDRRSRTGDRAARPRPR